MSFLKALPGLALCAMGITYLMMNRDAIIASAIICAFTCAAGVAVTTFIFKTKKA